MRILGHNTPRPKAGNYIDFEERLTSGLTDLGIRGLSLMLYGSYVRGDLNPGRSDIDAVLIFPDNVVINKEHLSAVSSVVNEALRGNEVPFQVTVTDLFTMIDGRFNSYDPSFKDYFDEEARITGVDYRPQFNYELPSMNDQTAVRFNLRKSRTGLLFAEHDRDHDYEALVTRFTKSLDAVSRSSKQILFFLDGTLRKNRFSALDTIRETFPEIDPRPLERIRGMYRNPERLDKLYRKPDEILRFWNSAVTLLEEMVRGYLEKVPRTNPGESQG